MSATLSGLIVLENAKKVNGLSFVFDGQMWLGPGRILTGIFRYYNSSSYTFPEIGHYIAWIQAAKFVPEGERQQPKEGQKDEEVANGASDVSSSADTVDEPDIFHVVGDIVHLIPIKTDDMQQRVYINISGAAVNINRTNQCFDVNAGQYTNHYKGNPSLSVLPVRAHFNMNKYRETTPMPSNNYVSVGGFLEDVEINSAGHATTFHMLVDNICHLGRANYSSPITSANGLGAPSTPSRSSRRLKYSFDTLSPTPISYAQVSPPNTPSTSDSGLV